MTKQTALNKIFKNSGLIFGAALLFVLSFILQINFSVAVFSLSIFLYLKNRKFTLNGFSLLNFSLLFVIIFAASYLIISKALPIFYIPFAVIPMLTTLLFNQIEISLLITLLSSISVAAIMPVYSPYLCLFFLISGILSSLMVLAARRRIAIIRAGLIIGVIQAITLIFLDRFWLFEPSRYLILVTNGIICSIIVLGTLPVFENLFKTVTNISLLELADFNHPLLQRMIQEAPGTYHHSLMVGNISEAACLAVGANALLARIGAYYHDIGKIQKPEYFSENQNKSMSLHDTLSATMSKLIIMNHVKEGAELAKKYKINPRLIDFILQHHGNSLVYYFYRRALEGLEEDQEIKEEGFRYHGPKPNSKETAIVLLADSVEAATRALKDPAPAKIEEIVHKVINNKFIDGQLDECELTLKDLEKISLVFIRILSGIYHGRITYPEGSDENNHKKSSKENSHQSQKDKGSSS